MYRRTGEHSRAAGVYHSECRCRSEITVRKGDVFPQCPKCKTSVAWLFTRSVYAAKPPAPPIAPIPPGTEPPDAGSGQ
jgi:hypothetical protein